MSRPAVSQHLKVLREAGIVAVRADAQRLIYRLEADVLGNIDEWLAKVRGFWSSRLDILDDVLHGRAPSPYWKAQVPLEAEYERRLQSSR
jgi:predicted transcriptional regulator